MRIRDSLKPLAGGHLIATFFCVSGLLWAVTTANAAAQTAQAPAPQNASAAPTLAPADSSWQSLSRHQKIALAPLEKFWDTLSDGQRRKWQALAKTYPDLGASEQEKLHSRMAEWAALSPKDREAARLNFAQAKAVTKTDRAANWEAYQALSPDERKTLAHGAKAKPVGAAVAVKPVASDKLTAVPVTRHTPEQERAAAVLQRPINRNTLLPQQTGSAAFSADVSTSVKP
jgi:hypothetical protein